MTPAAEDPAVMEGVCTCPQGQPIGPFPTRVASSTCGLSAHRVLAAVNRAIAYEHKEPRDH